MSETSLLDCGPIIEKLEQDLCVSTETMAAALGVAPRTVERWRTNQSVPQGQTRERLRGLILLRDQILQTFSSAEAGRTWLLASSDYLGGFTPEEALKAGRVDRVRAVLDGLASGIQ